MKKSDIRLKGGENIRHSTSIYYSLINEFPPRFKNEFTDGKYVTQEEFTRIIRKKKLNKMFKK